MKHGSLFSGIGGFDLAAEWMGWENVFHCEWNDFNKKILKHYWPNATSYSDIIKTDFSIHRGTIDIITGGFPCQPYSQAGKRKGKADDRHLWPEMLRVIREVQPRWVVGENVYGLLNWERGMALDEIKTDLETTGFEVFPPLVLPACSLNAPHRRDRVWIVAYSSCNSFNDANRNEGYETQAFPEKRFDEFVITTNTNNKGLQRSEINGGIERIGQNGKQQPSRFFQPNWENFPTQPPLCGRNDGIPDRVDRIKSLGNAIVPKVAYEIFKAIEAFELLNQGSGDERSVASGVQSGNKKLST